MKSIFILVVIFSLTQAFSLEGEWKVLETKTCYKISNDKIDPSDPNYGTPIISKRKWKIDKSGFINNSTKNYFFHKISVLNSKQVVLDYVSNLDSDTLKITKNTVDEIILESKRDYDIERLTPEPKYYQVTTFKL